MSKKKLSVLILTLVLVVMFSSICGAVEEGVTVGKSLPQFTLQGLNGNYVTVGPSDKVTIINFWATWCPPCRGEMPELNEFYLENGDKIVFYTVNLAEAGKVVNDFLYKNHYSLPTLLDTNNAVSTQFQVKYIPTTIITDRNGVIVYRASGPVTKSQLESIVNGLL